MLLEISSKEQTHVLLVAGSTHFSTSNSTARSARIVPWWSSNRSRLSRLPIAPTLRITNSRPLCLWSSTWEICSTVLILPKLKPISIGTWKRSSIYTKKEKQKEDIRKSVRLLCTPSISTNIEWLCINSARRQASKLKSLIKNFSNIKEFFSKVK